MRFLYLDDAGLSSISQEPFLVMAGALVDADRVWRSVNAHFRAIIADEWPQSVESTENHVFQAKHIWHGSHKFPKAEWTQQRRLSLLRRLLSVYKLHDIPVVYGVIDRAAHRKRMLTFDPTMSDAKILEDAYAMAFIICAQKADKWLNFRSNDEVAKIVVESNRQMRSVVSLVHDCYSHPDPDFENDVFVSERFVDGVSFEEKRDSKLLQMADHVAFVIKRHFQGSEYIDALMEIIRPNLVDIRRNEIRDIELNEAALKRLARPKS